MSKDDLVSALNDIKNGEVVFGPSLIDDNAGARDQASNADVCALIGLGPPGTGLVLFRKDEDSILIESMFRYRPGKQADLDALNVVKARVEAAQDIADQYMGPAQALVTKAQNGRLALDEYQGAIAKAGKSASALEALIQLSLGPRQTLKLGERSRPIGGLQLNNPWLVGRQEELVARVVAVRPPGKVTLAVAVDVVSGRADSGCRSKQQRTARTTTGRRWDEASFVVQSPLDMVLLQGALKLGAQVLVTAADTLRLGTRGIVRRIYRVAALAPVLDFVRSEVEGRLADRKLSELDPTWRP